MLLVMVVLEDEWMCGERGRWCHVCYCHQSLIFSVFGFFTLLLLLPTTGVLSFVVVCAATTTAYKPD